MKEMLPFVFVNPHFFHKDWLENAKHFVSLSLEEFYNMRDFNFYHAVIAEGL